MILSTPLLFLLLLSLLPNREDLEKQMFKDFVKGILAAFPIVAITIIFLGEQGFIWSVSRSYFYYLLRDSLLAVVLSGGLWFLLKGRSSKNYAPGHRFASAGAWLSGTFFFLSIAQVLIHDGRYSFYDMFLLPFIRFTMIAAATYLFSKYDEEEGFLKAVFLLLAPVSALIVNFIGFSFFMNVFPLAIVLTILFLGGSVFLFVHQGNYVMQAKKSIPKE